MALSVCSHVFVPFVRAHGRSQLKFCNRPGLCPGPHSVLCWNCDTLNHWGHWATRSEEPPAGASAAGDSGVSAPEAEGSEGVEGVSPFSAPPDLFHSVEALLGGTAAAAASADDERLQGGQAPNESRRSPYKGSDGELSEGSPGSGEDSALELAAFVSGLEEQTEQRSADA